MSKKQTISAAILLMISFWFSDLLAGQYFPDDLDMPARVKQSFVSYYPKFLESKKEPSLWFKAKDPNAVSYRLTYTGFKQKPVVLRLDRISRTKWVLSIKQADYSASDEDLKVDRKQRLTQGEIIQFQELFTQLQFWELPSVGAPEAEEMMDGTTWILEAVQKGKYHLIRRRAPTAGFWVDEGYEKWKKEEGFPDIDRATSEEVNRRLVAVGKFLVKLSGLELKLH